MAMLEDAFISVYCVSGFAFNSYKFVICGFFFLKFRILQVNM